MSTRKVTVFLTGDAYEALENSSYGEALNMTDIINRALIFYAAVGAAPEGTYVEMVEPLTGEPWKRVGILPV